MEVKKVVKNFSPELGQNRSNKGERTQNWRVILYNDNRNKLDNVLNWLQETAGCDSDFAIEICHVCQDQGRAVCFQGEKAACHEVTTALRAFGLQVEIDDY